MFTFSLIAILVLSSGLKAAGRCMTGEDPFCQACENEICEFCVNSYLDESGTCVGVAINTVRFCETYLSARACKECQAGYELQADGQCAALPFSCAIGALDGAVGDGYTCYYCFNGYSLNSFGTGCTSEMCQVPNCNWCGNIDNGCFWCRSGFAVAAENETCIENPPGIEHCIKLAAGNKGCYLCDEGYMITQNKTCARSPESDLDKTFAPLLPLALAVILPLFL